jgi:hypothetical protein
MFLFSFAPTFEGMFTSCDLLVVCQQGLSIFLAINGELTVSNSFPSPECS